MTSGGGSAIAADLARKLRAESIGAIYHVLSRGDRREPIFHEDADREVRLAQRWREETMVTLGWIARQPQMGAVA